MNVESLEVIHDAKQLTSHRQGNGMQVITRAVPHQVQTRPDRGFGETLGLVQPMACTLQGLDWGAHSRLNWTAEPVRHAREQVVVLALTVGQSHGYFIADGIMPWVCLHLYTAGMLCPPVIGASIVALTRVQLYARRCTPQLIL